MKDMPENIEKVVVEEYQEILKENKYLRAGNAKYTNNKVNLNTSYQDLSTIMDLSTTFDMLIKSKRVNIHSLCKAVIDSIASQNSIVLVLSLRSLLERLAYFDYFARFLNPSLSFTGLLLFVFVASALTIFLSYLS